MAGGKVAIWAEAVEILANIAVKYPQTAYAGFTFCLQNECQYVSHVCADTVPFFQSLEVSIWKYFCPALTGIRTHEIDAVYWELLSQSVKKVRLTMHNTLNSTAHLLDTLKAATKHLVLLMVDDEHDFDHNSH